MAKKRKYFRHGDILRISLLPYLEMNAYVKFINYIRINEGTDYPFVFRVYSIFSTNQDPSLQEITNSTLLTNPLLFFGDRKIEEDWDFVAKSDVNNDEIEEMVLRCRMGNRGQEYEFSHCVTNVSVNTIISCKDSMSVCDHLEWSEETYKPWIKFRIYIEYCKLNNIAIEYNNEEIEKPLYEKWKDIPIYKNIDPKHRQKCPC